MTFINRISPSKSGIIEECLWKYNLKYNLKIPGFGNKNEDALQFGSFIHKVFEVAIKENRTDLLKIAESLKKAYHVTSKENTRIQSCISNFSLWNKNLGDTLFTEGEVEVFLDKVADIKSVGVIDRIVKGSKGGFLVIDYKTSKREKKKAELLNDPQLKSYTYAVHEIHKVEYKDIHCGHFYPLSGNFVTVQFNAAQIAMWRRKEIDKVWRIRKKTKNDFPPQKNIYCGNCEFQQACTLFCTKEDVEKRIDEQIKLRDQLITEKKNLNENSTKNKDNRNKN